MSSAKGINTKSKNGLPKGSRRPGRYKYLSDPPVVNSPFNIKVDHDKCVGCGVCIKQCPCQTIEMVPRQEVSNRQSPGCQYRCPAGTDVRKYSSLLSRDGSLEEAWKIIIQTNPFPAVTGRVCPHPCEDSCNRAGVDNALNIHGMERVIGDYGIEKDLSFAKPDKSLDKKVAIAGAGPSGLSCAYQLARLGYKVTVFESEEKPGGMLSTIPKYRLPDSIVNAEISRILDLGITLKTGVSVGKDISLENIRREFAAVYIAPGAQGSTAPGIKGDENSIYSGTAFLKFAKQGQPLSTGKNVLVIGGGNTAIDAARAARRMGSDVTILYRRTASEMPAHKEEVDAAVMEGVKINFLCAPVAINNNGLTCVKMELGDADESGRPKPVPVRGSEFDVPVDTVIAAVGQDLQPRGFESLLGASWIAADALGVTKERGIFAGGDAVTGPGLVSEAIGAGRKAALAIDAFLNGEKAEWPERKEIDYSGVPLDDKNKISRNDEKTLDVAGRFNKIDAEVNLALDFNQVFAESKRCLGCGLLEPKFTGMDYFGKICIACHNCEAVCPQQALEFPNFYRVDEGRWAYDFDYPEPGQGIPNPLMLDKPVPLEEIESQLTGVEKVIYRRRSVRVYKKEPVPKELINRVLEAGRFAPSAGNCQGWKFVVITDRNVMDEISASTIRFLSVFTKLYQGKDPGRTVLKKMLAFIKPSSFDQRPMVAIQALSSPKFGEGKLDCFFGAPTAILLLTHRLHVSEPELGMGICGQNMVLAAHSLGLGTCYVGFISNTLNLDPVSKLKFRKKLGIEWPYDSVATVLTLGYPAVDLDKPVDREFPKVEWVE